MFFFPAVNALPPAAPAPKHDFALGSWTTCTGSVSDHSTTAILVLEGGLKPLTPDFHLVSVNVSSDQIVPVGAKCNCVSAARYNPEELAVASPPQPHAAFVFCHDELSRRVRIENLEFG